jgi:E3 SUMO-protein ligase RanBP2
MTEENLRIASLLRMMEARPKDARPRFGLALEYEKQGRWAEMVDVLREYLHLTDDEGNAYGRLAQALRQLGRDEEAREAYQQGIAAAQRHGHPTMAGEFEDLLEAME